MVRAASPHRCVRCGASLRFATRVPALLRAELGLLGRQEKLDEAIRLLESSGFELRQAKAIALHLARARHSCRKCGARLELLGLVRLEGVRPGLGLVQCLAPRRPSFRQCNCLNLVW